MATVREVLDNAYNIYLSAGTLREARGQLTNNIDDTTNQIELTGAGNAIGPSTMLVVEMEMMTVIAVSGATYTVIRGDRGTEASAHNANDIVWINPKWPLPFQMDALKQEIHRLSARGLFQMKTFDLRYVSSRRQYDIPIDVSNEWIEDYRVAWETTDSSYLWPWLRSYEIVRDMPKPGDVTDDAGTPITQTFPSGFTIILHEGGISGKDVRIWYRARFDPGQIQSLDDDVTVTGLHTEAHDILSLGIPNRLLPAREVARNLYETQGQTRRSNEVPPGSEQRSVLGLVSLYEDRIEDEVHRLNQWWPRYGQWSLGRSPSLSAGWSYA